MKKEYPSHSLRSRKRIYQNIHRFAHYKRKASQAEQEFLKALGQALNINGKQRKLLAGKGQRGEFIKTLAEKERKLTLELICEFISLKGVGASLSEQCRMINLALRIAISRDDIKALIDEGRLRVEMLAELGRGEREEACLEKLFPGILKKRKRWKAGGLEFIVYKKEHKTTRHTCFGYGGESSGADVHTTFSSTLVLLPNPEISAAGQYLSFSIGGYSSISERYDQDSVTIDCRFPDGRSMELRREYYYEKYGGRYKDAWGELERLGTYLQDVLGYDEFDGEKLRHLLRKMRSAFSY